MTSGLWLCDARVVQRIEDARQAAAGETMAKAMAFGDRDDALSTRMEGSVAHVAVTGVLTKKPDFFAMFFGFGNTTYPRLTKAVMTAAGNPAVREIVLEVDSPGGSVDGLFEALDMLDGIRRTSGKKFRARAENAQSAAYAIAAATGRIEAVGRGATIGSIGTAVSYHVSDNVVTLTNTDSPDKRPDLRTPHGKQVVVTYLDQINSVFVSSIARGRGVSAEKVREGYGRGASMTAEHAITLGMVDTIHGQAPSGGARAEALQSEPAPAAVAAWAGPYFAPNGLLRP